MIYEWKSVNDTVDNLADFVGKHIIEECHERLKTESRVGCDLFIEDSFTVNVSNFLKGGNVLTVNYLMYFYPNQEVYQYLSRETNSEADEETNSIKIVSAFIGKEEKVADDFYEIISHELNHLYHYGMGFEKRKTLYDKTKELVGLKESNIDAYFVGMCSYYSFKHEQDAFAQQYYKHLTQTKPKYNPHQILFSQDYKNFEYCISVLEQIKDHPKALEAIKYLGYSRKSFLGLVHYRKKRFYAKMRNVCIRFYTEMHFATSKTAYKTSMKRMDKYLGECREYGYEIPWATESIFDFSEP